MHNITAKVEMERLRFEVCRGVVSRGFVLQRGKLRREKGMGLRRRAGYVMEEEMLADFIQKEVEENEKRRRKKHTSLVVIVRQVPAWSVRPALSLCSPPLAKVGRKMRVHPQKQRPFVSTPAAMANSSSGLFPILNLFSVDLQVSKNMFA